MHRYANAKSVFSRSRATSPLFVAMTRVIIPRMTGIKTKASDTNAVMMKDFFADGASFDV